MPKRSEALPVAFASLRTGLRRLLIGLYAGVVVWFFAAKKYDWVEFFPHVVTLGLAAAVLVITGIWLARRVPPGTGGLRTFVTSTVLLLVIGFLSYLSLTGILMALNGALDRSAPKIYRQPILKVRELRGGYNVLVPPLSGGGEEPLSIGFPARGVDTPRVGDTLELVVGPGALGWPWLVESPRVIPVSPLSSP